MSSDELAAADRLAEEQLLELAGALRESGPTVIVTTDMLRNLVRLYDHRGERIAYLERSLAVADAGRALLRSNGADEDWEALRVALYELDGEPMTSDADPAPVPARVLLPAPDGADCVGAWWLLSTGDRLYAFAGRGVSDPRHPTPDLDAAQRDALVTLAAVRWARPRVQP